MEYEYDMSHEKRGLAVIYNQEYFDAHTGFKHKRAGTDVDLDSLIKSLELLEFKVQYFSDLTKDELIDSLIKGKNENSTNMIFHIY